MIFVKINTIFDLHHIEYAKNPIQI